MIQAFLKLIENREEGNRKDLYTQIYNKAKGDFTSCDALSLHGSLLIIEALLSHSKVDLQKQHYIEICENVLKLKDYKNPTIKRTIIMLILKLAACSVYAFVSKYLNTLISFIMDFVFK